MNANCTMPCSVTAWWQDAACCFIEGWRHPLPPPPPHIQNEQVSREERRKFGRLGHSRLFRHSLFSLSKNTSETAFLPAHAESEFHRAQRRAARSDLRSCFIYCTSRRTGTGTEKSHGCTDTRGSPFKNTGREDTGGKRAFVMCCRHDFEKITHSHQQQISLNLFSCTRVSG